MKLRNVEITDIRKTPQIAGIYYIVIGKKGYVGSTINLRKRLLEHFNSLKANRHHSLYLQNTYNKYKDKCVRYYILCTCPCEYLIKMEQWFLDNLEINTSFCTRKIADRNNGLKHTEETKKKFREIMNRPENKERVQNINKGKKRSPELIEKIASKLRGRKQSEESNQKRKDSWKKFKLSDKYQEWLSSMKELNKGRKLNERQLFALKNRKGHKLSEEHKRKLSAAKKGKAPKMPEGYKNKTRSLNDEIVKNIKIDVFNCLKNKYICEKYNISLHVLMDIKREKCYKEITI